MSNVRSLSYTTEALREQAQVWAEQLGLHLELSSNHQLLPCLELSSLGLALRMPNCSPMRVDFQDIIEKRCRPGVKKTGILRACKLKPGMRVIDATAGWGRDAAVLASSGAEVLMLEREPVLAALLQDGLMRLDAMQSIALDLELCAEDARSYLSSLTRENYPDIIYLDPMHPAREKSAKVKKDLYALQALLGADDDALSLLEIARTRTRGRVVVKWPARLPALLKPDYAVEGKTVRFDVYLAV
ncbi:MAG: class I SAM-dependent methyltransferase [Legionellaceae bacterium]|nr:class I SAM-dependent methyltransferase [Legionellaceae bacterium]